MKDTFPKLFGFVVCILCVIGLWFMLPLIALAIKMTFYVIIFLVIAALIIVVLFGHKFKS